MEEEARRLAAAYIPPTDKGSHIESRHRQEAVTSITRYTKPKFIGELTPFSV